MNKKNSTFYLKSMIMRILFLTVISCLFLVSCKRPDKIDLSEIHIQLIIHRFDQELFEIDIYALEDSIQSFQERYPRFFKMYNYGVLNIGSSYQEDYPEMLKHFITEYSFYETYKRIQEVFPDLDFLKNKLDTAFRYYIYYFPEKQVPEIYTYLSGYNQSVVTDSNLVGISLEKYLGADEELYNMLYPPLPQYMRYKMHKDKLPSDIMRAWGIAEFEFRAEKDHLLSRMIYEGRNMYFVKKMLPGEHDTLIWGYTPEKLDFCYQREKEMWTYLVENKLLFNNEKFRISQFIEDGPFTHDFTNKSPDRAAVWVGYRIVERYVNNTKIPLKNLMEETNYQKIFNESKYNP